MNQKPLNRGDGPICLCMVPTRELAQQVASVGKDFESPKSRTVCVYGGAPKNPQLNQIRRGIVSCAFISSSTSFVLD